MNIFDVLTGANGQLFGWQAHTWALLDQVSILLGLAMLLISLTGLVWAALSRDRIRRWLQRYRFPVAGSEAGEEETWDALVFTVSRSELPCWVMQQKRPAAVALLATDASADNARSIMDEAKRLGITVIGPKLLSDVDDPAEARDATAWLIRRLREQGSEGIAIDLTGGKTPMSIGAFMAAQEQNCDTLYVTSSYDPKLNRPDSRNASIRCITRAQ